MSETTRLDLARAEFLKTVTKYFRDFDRNHVWNVSISHEVEEAWNSYRDILDGKTENASLDESRWFCPHCGTKQPAFIWQMVGQVVIGVGALQYFNVFCGEPTCRKLLSVSLVGFKPDAEMMAAARSQIGGKFPRA